ncbi:MAG: methionyl-tRNA formyltransferase [Pirellulales bacterium]
MSDALRLVVMGTGPFAVPMFRAALASRHPVLALVTQPARVGRGNKPAPPSPMRTVALEHNLPVLDPESINTDEARAALQAFAPDLFLVADYGQILANETLDVARLGGVNLHGSLLPKYRGAAPINWAIYRGDGETGVTVIQMSSKVDAGASLAQARTPINPEENAVELERRLCELGAPLVMEVVDRLAAGAVERLPQDPSLATGARRLRKTDGEVDWNRTAAQIKNQLRALEPWPRTSTAWLRPAGDPMRLILTKVDVIDGGHPAEPGTVVNVEKDAIVVATGEGLIVIRELQPAGKRAMAAGEFLRGQQVKAGEKFGPIAAET